jgi:N-acyl-D-aspartate/D-glutamate deacylase
MALDLVIKNGTVVDGSGLPCYRADVGVMGGHIVEIGRIRAATERVIDAEGLIVAPGFIDGHTHMDAEVAWDLPGGARRLVQKADGIAATIIVNGAVALENGEPTGNYAGRVLKGRLAAQA